MLPVAVVEDDALRWLKTWQRVSQYLAPSNSNFPAAEALEPTSFQTPHIIFIVKTNPPQAEHADIMSIRYSWQ